MPAYGKTLRPAEVTALVAFMQTLRPSYQPEARDSTQAVNSTSADAQKSDALGNR
jgi:hypothetical protein